ncbi:MAG: hypothetical protein R2778_00670 [Saprospiraceae bacterium]
MEYDEYGFEVSWNEADESAESHEAPLEPHVPMREQFPEANVEYMGGISDGFVYRSIFAGSKLSITYDMIRSFLQEEGYGDIPLPETLEILRMFKKPRHPQLQFFEEKGYWHNPVKILFPNQPVQRNALLLLIYNEKAENHLLRFHDLA